jgi:hypothetical protein
VLWCWCYVARIEPASDIGACTFTPALCDIDDFLKAFEFARTPRHCKLPKKHKHEDEYPAELVSAASPSDGVNASQYISTGVLLGLVALCVILGVRVMRSPSRSRRGHESTALLG